MTGKFLQTIICMALFSVAAHAESGIEIRNAWIRSAPPNSSVMAAYLTLSNHTPQTITLEGAASPDFEKITIHRSSMHNGMTKMKHVGAFPIEPQQQVIFEPGGMHLMLINPNRPMHRGNKVSIQLRFSNGEELSVDTIIRDADNQESMEMDHGHKHHHE